MPHSRQQPIPQHPKKTVKRPVGPDKMWVTDYMSSNPICIGVDETVDVAAQLLAENNIRHLPVVDSDGNLQGVISDRDLLGVVLRSKTWVLKEQIESLWQRHRVSEIMTKTPETTTPDADLVEAGITLLDNKISCLPVVEGSRVVGILTESDYVKAVCQY